ncbi:MAG: hypothetical protein H0U85_05775 [Gemmatimonadales bacterium]|nr:hypothetical protein [Gemmatimonadales bacterium]MBA3710602.1 hypothetical protein [Planctomycetota bacterium]
MTPTRCRRAFALLLLLGAAGACRKAESDRGGRAAAPPLDPVAADAESLGRELFEIIDRATEYRGSHRGRYPVSVAQIGIDSLTPATVRRLISTAATLTVTVAFRQPASRAIASCTAASDILEAAALNEGRFPLTCVGTDGAARVLLVSAGSR